MKDLPILLVDDDVIQLQTFQQILEVSGHIVRAFETGGEALKYAGEERFGLAILDIKLPDIRGDDVAKRLRETDPGIPIVLITGYPSMQSCIDALELGIEEILLKPIEGDELVRVAQEALKSK